MKQVIKLIVVTEVFIKLFVFAAVSNHETFDDENGWRSPASLC